LSADREGNAAEQRRPIRLGIGAVDSEDRQMRAKLAGLGRRELVIHAVLGVCSGGAMALAAFLLIAPNVGPPPVLPFQDKLLHTICFAALTGPAVLVLPPKYLGFWLAHMAMLGAGIEFVQSIGENGRTGSVWDFLADLVGIALSLGIGRLIRAQVELPKAG
jgi:hypothetical protein